MSAAEDDAFVLYGPSAVGPIPIDSIGKIIYDSLLEELDTEKPALIDAQSGEFISYRTLLEEACRLAEALRRFGCDSKTVVSISSENNLRCFVPMMATLFAGSIVATVNTFYSPHELKHVLGLTSTSIVFVSKDLSGKFVDMKKELGFIKKVVVFNTDEEVIGAQSIRGFIFEQLGVTKVSPVGFQVWNGDPYQTAFVLYSSGTTGLPKGTMLTHKCFATRVAQSHHPLQCYTKNGTISGVIPFFHCYGLSIGIISIINKEAIVFLRRFNEDEFLKAIERYHIDTLMVAPPLAVFMAKSPKVDQYDLSSLKEVICGGALLNKDVEVSLTQRLNLKTIRQGYGLTEALLVTMLEYDDRRVGTCGKVMPYGAVKIRDPTTARSMGPREVGEICYKSPTVMKGYYRNELATMESFTSDGWLRTGDLGYYDDEGYFYFVDRLKELIKYNGYQVAPAELEDILLGHPKVLEAAVVGVSDERAGELPLAFVVKKFPDVTEEELQDFVASKVSPQKKLRGGVFFLSSLPKNSTGKVIRKELKQRVKEYYHNQV